MKVTKTSLKYKILKTLYYAAIRLDNSANCNFNTNGEQNFIQKLFEELKTKTQITLFDIGGNVGDYTQMLFKGADDITQNFTIHVFEPTQYCFDKLSNRFDDERVVLNKIACSDSGEGGEIYYDIKGSELASMYQRNLKRHNIAELSMKEVIKTKRLDEYIEENDIMHIDFMKVDVEGHEMCVFEGMGRYLNSDFLDYIQFEYGGANLDSMTSLMNFYELFEAKGFRLAKVMPGGLQLRDHETFLENFVYSNYVAISKRLINIS